MAPQDVPAHQWGARLVIWSAYPRVMPRTQSAVEVWAPYGIPFFLMGDARQKSIELVRQLASLNPRLQRNSSPHSLHRSHIVKSVSSQSQICD